MALHVQGPAKTEGFEKTASVAIAAGAVLSFASGRVRQAIAASTRLAGVSVRKVASTDSDYADNTIISVIIPSEDDVFEIDVQSGQSATIAANLGRQYDLSTNTDGTAQTVNLTGTTYKVVTVVGVISTSKVLVKFNGNYAFANKDN